MLPFIVNEAESVSMTLPVLTPRLVLRRYTHQDVPGLLALVCQPSLAAALSARVQPSAESVREYIDRQNAYQPFGQDQVFELAVQRQADGKLIGFVGMIRREQAQAEIGWGLGEEYRGQGYATEASRALMGYGFRALGLHRIFADCACDNLASVRVMQRLGMRREAVLRGALYAEGRWVDQCVYAMLADEWCNARA